MPHRATKAPDWSVSLPPQAALGARNTVNSRQICCRVDDERYLPPHSVAGPGRAGKHYRSPSTPGYERPGLPMSFRELRAVQTRAAELQPVNLRAVELKSCCLAGGGRLAAETSAQLSSAHCSSYRRQPGSAARFPGGGGWELDFA